MMTGWLKKQIATRRSLLEEFISVGRDCVRNNITNKFKVLMPSVFQINVNTVCNARCQVCNIWKTNDSTMLSLVELETVFSDAVFRGMEYVIISGGEPSLRKDLDQVVRLMLGKMPALRKISIPTNGLATDKCLSHISRIATECVKHEVFLSVGISLDGVDGVYERVRGVKGGYEIVVRTLSGLKELKKEVDFQLSIGSTLSGLNIYDARNLLTAAHDLELDINFVVAAMSESYFNNKDLADNVNFNAEQKRFLTHFLRERKKESPWLSEMPFYYEKALEMVNGAKRSMPCPYQDQGLVLDADGSIHYCTNSRTIGNVRERSVVDIYHDPDNLSYRRQLLVENCPTCQISCFVGVGLRKTVFPFLAFLGKRGLEGLMNRGQ
jgi:MoaA/NifB/PqqE/SkfB family radical SAM enzyme